MSEYKKAVDAWIESDDFKRSSEPRTLRAPSDYRMYLENRLRTAFAAGWNARDELGKRGSPDER